MEDDNLYSVKWYRNEQEFYRFVPNDRPKLQIFPQDGIRVEVNQLDFTKKLTDLKSANRIIIKGVECFESVICCETGWKLWWKTGQE